MRLKPDLAEPNGVVHGRRQCRADDKGAHRLFRIDLKDARVTPLSTNGHIDGFGFTANSIVYAKSGMTSPTQLYLAHPKTGMVDEHGLLLTNVNASLAKKTFGAYEQFTFPGWNNETVHGYVVKPATYVEGKKYPVVFLIHGGPQGSFGDHFHYRWNPEVFAGHGYGVVTIDFHGSTGYGQAFTDAIRGDWGGAPYDDLMLGLDAALAKYPWLDGTRVAALGGSYGAYMVNWINGKTDRFKALVAHAGNLDERMAYFDTEELWFPEWLHGGVPWEQPEGYLKHNPIDLVKNWKTPTLVVHGALDYRVVDIQGMSTFTALQRRGVASRFLYFPDEGHWVLKPQNSRLWHQEVLGWLDRWTKR